MRGYPAEWPVTDGLDDTLPTIYLHVVDSTWPPADDDTGTPAGWSEITDWDITAGLVAALMPGQVNTSPGFTAATGGCKVPQPEGHHLAPWRTGADRTPTVSLVELWASHDGPTGSTAFLLGQFRLDPMKGRLSDPFLSVTYVQDTVRLRKPHDLPRDASGIFGPPFSPTNLLQAGASNNGFTLNSTADFEAELTSSYFPRKIDELDAMQQIVAANLGAMFLSMDGVTLNVLDPDYLLGTGTIVDTLDVADDLDDLSWAQDPNAAVDRIEITYLPPADDDTPMGPFPYDAAAVWFAPKGAKIPPHGTVTFDFDPGSAIFLNSHSPTVYGNTSKNGTGTSTDLPADVNVLSSGSWTVTITNPTASTQYLMAPYIAPGGGVGLTDYSKNTRSFLAGTIDGANESSSQQTLTWGVSTEDATNVLTFDLGRNIQTAADAQRILDRIITRITQSTYVLDDVQVPLDFRRELGDIYRAAANEVGFDTRLMVTGIKLTGTKDSIVQTLSLAVIPLTIRDLNEAWDTAHPGSTIADFNTLWSGKTIADLNADPLRA